MSILASGWPLVPEQAAAMKLEPAQKPGRSKQDYGTPWEFIHAVERRFGPILCDVAASAENAKCSTFITKDEDTFSVSWAKRFPTGLLWFNPEFGDIERCAAKCVEESADRHGFIAMLTPASIGSNWFAKFVADKACVLGLNPRIQFVDTPDPYPKDLMLSLYGYGLTAFDTWRWK